MLPGTNNSKIILLCMFWDQQRRVKNRKQKIRPEISEGKKEIKKVYSKFLKILFESNKKSHIFHISSYFWTRI